MSEAEKYLDRWHSAGLIDGSLRQRILLFEAARREQPAAAHDQRPGVVEVLLYLGVAIAIAGVFGLAAQHWEALGGVARLATFAIPGGLALIAGAIMRRTARPQFLRACGIAWLAAVALLGGAVAVGGQQIGWSGAATALVVALIAAALASGLYLANPSASQQLALAGSLFVLAESVAGQGKPFHPEAAGLLMLVAGAAGIVLAERRSLRPADFAAALGALLVLAGALHLQFAFGSGWAGVPLLAAGAALVAVSLRRGRFSYLLAGVLAIFLGLVWFIFVHFERTIGVPAALVLTGCLLVGGVLAITTWHRRRQARLPGDPPGAAGAGTALPGARQPIADGAGPPQP